MLDYEDRVIKCIDLVLEQLGIDVRRTLLFYLRREKGIKHYEIFQNPTQFITALQTVLGDASKVIERKIIITIENEFDLKHDEDHDLLYLLIDIQNLFYQKKKDEKIESNDDKSDFTYMQYTKNPIKE